MGELPNVRVNLLWPKLQTLLVKMMQPCTTLLIDTQWITKMYKGIRKKKKIIYYFCYIEVIVAGTL
jgi:hypothetical protein